jgi:hypothetical protein
MLYRFTLHTLHYSTLYTPPFPLHTTHFALRPWHCTFDTSHPQSTLYTLHSTYCTPHSRLYTPHCALPIPHSTLHTLNSTLQLHTTGHSTLHSLQFALHTPHFALCTPHIPHPSLLDFGFCAPLRTLHSTLYTPDSFLNSLYTWHFYTPDSTLYTSESSLDIATLSTETLKCTPTPYTFQSCFNTTLPTQHFPVYILCFALHTLHPTLCNCAVTREKRTKL